MTVNRNATDNGWIVGPQDAILVTGANGFIGTRVVKTLLDFGFRNLRCFVRPSGNLNALERLLADTPFEGTVFKGNLLSLVDCRKATEGVAVILHLAAGIEKSFPGSYMNSVLTTRNLLQASVQAGTLKRFLNVSSFAVYSNWGLPRGALLDETCPLEDHLIERSEPYCYGKAKQDEIVLAYHQDHGIPYVIVRPGAVYGPGKPGLTARVGIDTFGIFLHLGNSNQIPLTYVDNCAEAMVLAGIKQGVEGEVFNIVDDELPSSRDFLRLYKRNVRRFSSVAIPYRVFYLFSHLWEWYSRWSRGQLPPVFNRRRCAAYWKGNRYSNQKLKRLLGWKPAVSFPEALERFFKSLKSSQGQT